MSEPCRTVRRMMVESSDLTLIKEHADCWDEFFPPTPDLGYLYVI